MGKIRKVPVSQDLEQFLYSPHTSNSQIIGLFHAVISRHGRESQLAKLTLTLIEKFRPEVYEHLTAPYALDELQKKMQLEMEMLISYYYDKHRHPSNQDIQRFELEEEALIEFRDILRSALL